MVKSLSNASADLENIEAAFVTLTDNEPSNYKEAMCSHNANQWIEACKHEYDLIMGYGTWDLMDAPLDTNIVSSRWTFQAKCDNLGQINQYKAQLVAQGFSQIPGINFHETYVE